MRTRRRVKVSEEKMNIAIFKIYDIPELKIDNMNKPSDVFQRHNFHNVSVFAFSIFDKY